MASGAGDVELPTTTASPCRPFLHFAFDVIALNKAASAGDSLAGQPLATGHIPVLDALRGAAILVVTLYRFRGPEDGSPWAENVGAILSHGNLGVDLFFVLSGFLITGILYDAKGQGSYFRNFYARRALRIFPLYYGVLVAALVLAPEGFGGDSLATAQRHQGWLWTYSANLLIASRAEWCLGWFDHFWSLSIEEHFYFVWPLVIFSLTRRRAMWVAGLGAGLSAISRFAWLATGGDGIAAETFTLFRLDGILLGAWLALAARGPYGLARITAWARPVALMGAVLVAASIVVDKRFLSLPTSIAAVFFTAAIALAVGSTSNTWLKRSLDVAPLRVLGKYSYGMYVFQNPLLLGAPTALSPLAFRELFGSSLAGGAAYLATMFALTFAAAFVSWHLYEKRFLKLKRYFEGGPARTPAFQSASSQATSPSS